MPPSSECNEPARRDVDESGLTDVELLEIRLDDDLQMLETKLDAAYDDVESRKDEVGRRELELERRAHLLALRESKTRLQRRRVAEQLSAKRAELAGLGRTDSHAADSSELDEARRQCDNLKRELKLQRELADEALNESAALRANPSGSVESDHLAQRLQSDLESAQAEIGSLQRQATSLEAEKRAEIERLSTQLDTLQRELSEGGRQSDSGPGLAEGDDAGEVLPSASSGFDWEAQKRRLIEEMGDESGTVHEGLQAVERSRAVVETGVAVSADEVEMLREQMHSLLNAIASTIGGGAEDFDFAATLEEEREKLREIQREWHDKLRDSELEISVERAKLARETVKLEESMRMLEQEKRSITGRPVQEEAPDKPVTRGRWLARLGLSDKDE